MNIKFNHFIKTLNLNFIFFIFLTYLCSYCLSHDSINSGHEFTSSSNTSPTATSRPLLHLAHPLHYVLSYLNSGNSATINTNSIGENLPQTTEQVSSNISSVAQETNNCSSKIFKLYGFIKSFLVYIHDTFFSLSSYYLNSDESQSIPFKHYITNLIKRKIVFHLISTFISLTLIDLMNAYVADVFLEFYVIVNSLCVISLFYLLSLLNNTHQLYPIYFFLFFNYSCLIRYLKSKINFKLDSSIDEIIFFIANAIYILALPFLKFRLFSNEPFKSIMFLLDSLIQNGLFYFTFYFIKLKGYISAYTILYTVLNFITLFAIFIKECCTYDTLNSMTHPIQTNLDTIETVRPFDAPPPYDDPPRDGDPPPPSGHSPISGNSLPCDDPPPPCDDPPPPYGDPPPPYDDPPPPYDDPPPPYGDPPPPYGDPPISGNSLSYCNSLHCCDSPSDCNTSSYGDPRRHDATPRNEAPLIIEETMIEQNSENRGESRSQSGIV